MIDAYVIVIEDNDVSQKGFATLSKSSSGVGNEFDVVPYPAVTPDQVDEQFEKHNVKWTWPDSGVDHCPITNLRRHAYGGKNPKRRHACFWSHCRLWQESVSRDIPILVLEHDAKFVKKLNPEALLESDYGVIGINSPFGATRLQPKYHSVTQGSEGDIVPCPEIDRWEVPQGIAGASAYLIKPWAAKQVIEKIKEVGAWPNDAIICRQLFDFIGQTKTYYTEVQGLPSTTTSLA